MLSERQHQHQHQQHPPPDEPLVIVPLAGHFTYAELIQLVQKLEFSGQQQQQQQRTASDSHNSNNHGGKRRLLPDLALHIVQYLTIERVHPEEVQAVRCSSTDGTHPLKECLTVDQSTWWISAPGSMPNGKGREYVEFRLSSKTLLRRLSRVSITISPYPAGPLSVRVFALKAPMYPWRTNDDDDDDDDDDNDQDQRWYTLSVFQANNVPGPQHFDLSEVVDTDRVRLVCKSNQVSYLYRFVPPIYHSVGFFTVAFE